MTDFIIVGAGINGLLTARELARAGATVTLLDQGGCGEEASWAGGGIVSPLYPWRYHPAVTALASWAQDFYPALTAELERETGIDPELERSGLLMLDAADGDEALGWAQRHGRPMRALETSEVYRRMPQLGPGFSVGLWMEGVSNVRNPRLLKALRAALMQNPLVEIHEYTRVQTLRWQGAGIAAVEADSRGRHEVFHGANIIVCAGAWSARLLRQLGVELAVEPVKGQMLLYRLQADIPASIVLAHGKYIIPRRDGHVLAGSTLEYTGFDKSVDGEAAAQLREAAESMWPALSTQEPLRQWAGLRPGTVDGIPYIGRLGEWENLFVNAGQFRNGLVLAPASARLLADSLLGRQEIVDPAPYLPVNRVPAAGNTALIQPQLL